MFTKEEAKELLTNAKLFYDVEDLPEDEVKFSQTLNMNDVWAWALADCEEVADEELVEVATLFRRYGWCGILYWASKKNGGMRSEFLDNNRFIDFVEHEESLRKEVPNPSERAYKKIGYILGG